MIYDYRDAKQLKVDLISGCEKQNPLGSGGGLRWAQSALLNILFLAGGIFFFFFFGIGSVSRVPSLCAVAKDEEDDDKRSKTAGEAGRLTTEEERHEMEGYWSMVSDVTIC